MSHGDRRVASRPSRRSVCSLLSRRHRALVAGKQHTVCVSHSTLLSIAVRLSTHPRNTGPRTWLIPFLRNPVHRSLNCVQDDASTSPRGMSSCALDQGMCDISASASLIQTILHRVAFPTGSPGHWLISACFKICITRASCWRHLTVDTAAMTIIVTKTIYAAFK
jgi:hypothetical protein